MSARLKPWQRVSILIGLVLAAVIGILLTLPSGGKVLTGSESPTTGISSTPNPVQSVDVNVHGTVTVNGTVTLQGANSCGCNGSGNGSSSSSSSGGSGSSSGSGHSTPSASPTSSSPVPTPTPTHSSSPTPAPTQTSKYGDGNRTIDGANIHFGAKFEVKNGQLQVIADARSTCGKSVSITLWVWTMNESHSKSNLHWFTMTVDGTPQSRSFSVSLPKGSYWAAAEVTAAGASAPAATQNGNSLTGIDSSMYNVS